MTLPAPFLRLPLEVAMLTAPRPLATADHSLAELRRAGFDQEIHVFAEPGSMIAARGSVRVHANAQRLGMWPNWLQAARYLLQETSAPYLLICEDDIRLRRDAAGQLEVALRELPADTFGLASLFTPAHNVEGVQHQRGWLALDRGWDSWGSLAYCFRRESLAALLEAPYVRQHGSEVGTDMVVCEGFRQLDRRCYFHLPSLCAHTGDLNSSVGHISTPLHEAVGFATRRKDAKLSAFRRQPATVVGDRQPTDRSPSPQPTKGTQQVEISPPNGSPRLAIPRVFHRIWLGPRPMPQEFRRYGQSWLARHPGWTMRHWTDSNLPRLQNQRQYDNARWPSVRSDIVRYELLWNFGGVYVDTDFECLRNIEPLLAGIDAFVAWEDEQFVCNALIGARPRHSWVGKLIERLPHSFDRHIDTDAHCLSSATGPRFVTRLIDEGTAGNGNRVRVFPRDLFYPRHWSQTDTGSATHPRAFAVHHWSRLWHEPTAAELTGPERGPVLLLADFQRLSRREVHSIRSELEALRRYGAIAFGPGSRGFRPGMSIEEAVAVTCRGTAPRAVIHALDHGNSARALVSGLANYPALKVMQLHDVWDRPERQASFINEHGFDLAWMPYAGYLDDYRRRCGRTEFFWHPNSVDTQVFRDWRLPKRYDVLLYGRLDRRWYPFRARLAELLARQSNLRVQILPHPGYPELGESPPDVYYAEEALSRQINQAWISIATCGRQAGLFYKYFEIAASGSALAGTLPPDGRELFGGNMIELDPTHSDSQLLVTLRHALADESALRQRIAAAGRMVRQHHSTIAWTQRLLGAIDERITQGPRR